MWGKKNQKVSQLRTQKYFVSFVLIQAPVQCSENLIAYNPQELRERNKKHARLKLVFDVSPSYLHSKTKEATTAHPRVKRIWDWSTCFWGCPQVETKCYNTVDMSLWRTKTECLQNHQTLTNTSVVKRTYHFSPAAASPKVQVLSSSSTACPWSEGTWCHLWKAWEESQTHPVMLIHAVYMLKQQCLQWF